MHTYSGAIDWQGRRSVIALKTGRMEQKRWPLHEKVPGIATLRSALPGPLVSWDCLRFAQSLHDLT